MQIETVKVKREGPKGCKIINKTDFDPEIHELYESDPTGPTRDEMKAYLTEKGVEFPQNIKGDKLAEMYAEAKAE